MQSAEEKKIVEEITPEDVKPKTAAHEVQEHFEDTKHDPYAVQKPSEAKEVHSILPQSHGHAHLAAREPAVQHVDLAKLSGTGKSGPNDIGTELDSVKRPLNGDLMRAGGPLSRVWRS